MTVSSPISPASPSPRGNSAPAAQKPPEWPIERHIKTVGKLPAALGRALDRLAKVPVLGVVVRLFSSVILGITILALIGIYIAVGSGLASVRAHFEMTDLEFFNAWPMRVLLTLLLLDLGIVTLRRIPLTLFKLGSWTVHVGIFTLIGGAVWYFSCKQEGSVRIYLNKSVDTYYDVTERALYAFPMSPDGSFDTARPASVSLPGLPIFFEHLAALGNGLNRDLLGALAPLGPAFKDVGVRITGYYPSAVLEAAGWRAGLPGETGHGPGIAVQFSDDRNTWVENWLVAAFPSNRVLETDDMPLGVEYLYHPTPQRLHDVQTSFDGQAAITVRIPALNIDRTYPVKQDTPIVVEGSPYILTPKETGGMPMASKGYEGAFSTTLMIDVARKDSPTTTFNYQRMALSRYPERSPDFIMENGKNTRKQDGVDPAISITFHDASRPQVWIVEDTAGTRSLVVRDTTGKSTTQPLAEKPVPLNLAFNPKMKVQITDSSQNAVAVYEPTIIPNNQRPRGISAMEAMQFSILEVELTGTSPDGKPWKRDKRYVPFSPYAQVGDRPDGEQPTVIDIPGAGSVGLLLATTKRQLPSTVTLTKFEPIHFPGATRSYADYISTLSVRDHGTTEDRPLVAQLNAPASDHGLYYFQSAWDGDDNAPPNKRFTVLGVANRPGIHVMTAGAILIIVGIGYAFYAKPILLKKKKESLAAWAKKT